MKIALNGNKEQINIENADKDTTYFCIICGGELKAKKGKKKQYFSHLIGKNDDCEAKLNNILYNIKNNKAEENTYIVEDSDLFANKYNDLVEDINGFTEEQLLVINSKEKRIKVDSKAGTGKTSVCEEYIKVNSNKSILYMIFNKSMAEEAKERFGHLSNVEIRTTYSMAYQAIGYQYKHKLTTSYNLFNVANAINIRMYKPEDYKYVSELENLFTLYLSSWYYDVDSFINSLPYKDITSNHRKDLKKLFNESKKIDNDVKITHGFYFKLWHLSKPDLSNYDCVIVDEFNDSQGALVDIVIQNKDVDTIMIVGDAQQNIYGFMNTINGLKVLNEGWVEYNLTKSFRIGNTNAHLIKSCMSEVLGRDFNIEGYNKKQIIVEEVDITKPHYKLCRYNSTIIDDAIISALDGKKIYIEGGSAGVDFTYIKLIYDFWKYGKQHYSLKKYNNYNHMINTARKINDVSILQAHKLITEHQDNLLFKLKSIEENLVKDWELADVCYSTIHKSKGMTITIPVIIADDVIDLNEVTPSTLEKHEQEVNLLYVALSRSKNKIQIPSSVLYMYEGLKYNKESI